MLETSPTLHRSGKFIAPGHPLPPERLALVRQALHAELRALAADHGLDLQPGQGPDEHLLQGCDASLNRLCDLAESVLKRLALCLSADLIGGANVTRLDRSIALPHPRLPYRRTVRIVSGRGWRLSLGDRLPAAAQASLVRFCGLLPVQMLYLPGQPRPACVPPDRQGMHYLLPWGGLAIEAEAPLPAATGSGLCRLHGDRLLHFLLGLAEPETMDAGAG